MSSPANLPATGRDTASITGAVLAGGFPLMFALLTRSALPMARNSARVNG